MIDPIAYTLEKNGSRFKVEPIPPEYRPDGCDIEAMREEMRPRVNRNNAIRSRSFSDASKPTH